jgi:hypothetical protein
VRAPRNQVFLERRSYRMRRLADAARLLPVLGLGLFLLPMFWQPEVSGEDRQTTWDGVYLFVVWVGLIVLAAVLSRRLLPLSAASSEPEDKAGRGARATGE